MHMTPQAVVEQAKNIFMSENFSGAILILRDCMDEEHVSTETIVSLLKGETGYEAGDDWINIDDKFIDEDYALEIAEVLENYDFLTEVDGVNYQIKSMFSFDLSEIAPTNDWIQELKDSEDKLTLTSSFRYFDEINDIMMENGYFDFDLASHILYHNGHFFVFKRYDERLIEEVCKFYTPIEAAKQYLKVQNQD